jgi:hypothetical protein
MLGSTYGSQVTKLPPPVPSRSSTPPPSSPPSDLSKQLLDEKTEKFYKEIIADEYAVFRIIQCVSESVRINESQFKNTILKKIKNKIKNKIQPPKNPPFANYNQYMLAMGQHYESIVLQYLTLFTFKELSKLPYIKIDRDVSKTPPIPYIVSPFSQEMKGLITRSIISAGGVAAKIPGFQGEREKGSAPFDEYFNALPPETLQKFEKCTTDIQFNADKLKESKAELVKYIRTYNSKNKAQSLLGSNSKYGKE